MHYVGFAQLAAAWGMSPFEPPSVYGGCTLEPVIGLAIPWP
jgi:hypothetical protein